MKNQWRLIVGIVLVLIIIMFSVLNVESVPVNFGFGEVIAPLIIIIVISLLLGSVLTLIVSTTSTAHTKKEMKGLRRQVDDHEKQLKESVSRVREEYEAKLTKNEELLIAKENVIKDLEDEILNQFTINHETADISDNLTTDEEGDFA